MAQNLRKFGVRPIFNKIEEDALNYGEQDVEVYLPRLETTSTLSLRGTLEAVCIEFVVVNA